MKKIALTLIFSMLIIASVSSQKSPSDNATQIINAIEGTLSSNVGGSVSLLRNMNDDEAIQRVSMVLQETTIRLLTSSLDYLPPSDQRYIIQQYSYMISFMRNLDVQFDYIKTLRDLYKEYPASGGKSLLWLFSTAATKEIAILKSSSQTDQ